MSFKIEIPCQSINLNNFQVKILVIYFKWNMKEHHTKPSSQERDAK